MSKFDDPLLNNQIVPLFIFSLPRTGSTLTQRILAAHPDVTPFTVSEPHLLLYFLYSLKEEGVYSKVSHKLQVLAIQEFCEGLPNGVDDYLAEIRTFVLRLYAKAATGNKVKYIIDKTPEYYLVVEDIIRLFPEGKFLFLWRNPLSVISSLLTTWNNGRWVLYRDRNALFEGLANLIEAYKKFNNRVYAVRYEDLVLNPAEMCQQVFTYLELPFDSEVLSRFAEIRFKGSLGDPNVNNKENLVLRQDTLEKWKNVLTNPLRKAWCRSYLQWIGPERLAVMGYDLDQLMTELDTIPFNLRFLVSDMWWMPYDVAYRIFEGRIIKQKFQDLQAGRQVYMHS